jgi:CDP-diacylglycerol--glycerol-3-phosphate 3-phosphatidyltransferase
MLFILLPDFIGENCRLWCDLVAAAIFGIASFTDYLDGHIARSQNLVTDFGKFMDPIADKLMVFGAFLCFMVSDAYSIYRYAFAIVVFIVLLREFAVTSLRLVAQSSGGKVIAADKLGKLKTVMQICFILFALLEKHIFFMCPFCVKYMPVTCALCITMLVLTVVSGINYLKNNKEFLDPTK